VPIGSAGGGDGLTLSETGIMATAMGISNELKMKLINWGLKGSSGWGNTMSNFNYGIEQSNQIQNGNWGVSFWRPGQGLR
jgi:hypothetical protein